MEQAKRLLIGVISKKFSLSEIKKATVLFVLVSMFINGFTYGAAEASRHSFVVAAATVAGHTINQLFSKCNDSLIMTANEISKGIGELLKTAFGVEAGAFGGSKEEKKEERGTSGSGAAGEITILKVRKQIIETGSESGNIFESAEKLFKLYMNYKIPSGEARAGLIIMTFIMFIVGIRQRKGITASGNIILNRVRKIRISA
ncbi:MAG: hypothetical protein FWD54_05125 [Endomicrobia bacterium]|nr:hypothetical protein [Endomicrobiia bacterium]MCL2799633.1 hypothetical protein [Endomicrobiia bacterium]